MGFKIRKSTERGFFDHGWLQTYHTFSFGNYYDPHFMGFRHLRVINDDRIAPGKGFPLHSHEDMEIITILLEGELAHKDSMGNEEYIYENEIQEMSAGTGVSHSEYNPSDKKHTHLYQIWIQPEKKGIEPRYQQKKLPKKKDDWVLVASKTGESESLPIAQDVKVYVLNLSEKTQMERKLGPKRYGWLQVMEGEISFLGETLRVGDGVAIDQGTLVDFTAKKPSKILFFDLN